MISDTAPATPSVPKKRSLGALIEREQRRKRKRRLVLAGVLLALLAAGGVLAVRLRPQPPPLAARFRTELVSRGDVLREVLATGHVEAVTTVQVGAEISGRIATVEVDYNDPVRQGQVLARFDRTALAAQRAQSDATLAAARATLAQTQAEHERARSDAARAEQLFASHVVTEAQRDLRVAEARVLAERVRAVAAELSARRAAATLARTNLDHAVISAPIDGVVITRNVDPGQTVASVLQTPVLFTVAADLRKMHVIAAVDEADIGEVRDGQVAAFTVSAYPGRSFRGAVTQVRNSPTNVQDVVTYGVELTVDNDDLALKPGMTAAVRIATDEARDALRVPASALSFTPPGETPATTPSVWLLAGEALHRMPVRPGVSDGELTAITAAQLAPGAHVLVELTPTGRSAYGIAH